MNFRVRLLTFGIAAGLLLSGCASGFTRIAPRPPDKFERLGRVEGSACGAMLLLGTAYYFIPVNLNERVANAYQDALSKAWGQRADKCHLSGKLVLVGYRHDSLHEDFRGGGEMGVLKDTRYTTRLWFCLVAGFLLSGCVGTPVTFPEVDNKTIGRSHGRAIGAGSCGFQLLLLIPININNRAERAYAELSEAAGSDVIAWCPVRRNHGRRHTFSQRPSCR